ncbi:MAG: hypothetical protein GX820_01195 [Bacteroidales bacterium]|nr:hypothetical protein [Bacteroidales bacterium]
MKKFKLIILAIVVTVIIVGVGIYDKLFSLDMMRVKETFMLGDIYVLLKYNCPTNEVDGLIMCGGSPLNIYFTNRVFTFDGSNIVAQFAYSEMIDGKQLFASTNMLFWVNRSGKIGKGPIKMVSSIQTTREELNMEKFIKGWIWVSHRGTEKRQDEYMQTNSGAIFLTNQVFSFGGSNITARFASPRKVDDRQLFANTNMIFWVDSLGKIEGEPHKVRAPREFDRQDHNKMKVKSGYMQFLSGTNNLTPGR